MRRSSMSYHDLVNPNRPWFSSGFPGSPHPPGARPQPSSCIGTVRLRVPNLPAPCHRQKCLTSKNVLSGQGVEPPPESEAPPGPTTLLGAFARRGEALAGALPRFASLGAVLAIIHPMGTPPSPTARYVLRRAHLASHGRSWCRHCTVPGGESGARRPLFLHLVRLWGHMGGGGQVRAQRPWQTLASGGGGGEERDNLGPQRVGHEVRIGGAQTDRDIFG